MTQLPPDLRDLAQTPEEAAAFAAVTHAFTAHHRLPDDFNERLQGRLTAPRPAPARPATRQIQAPNRVFPGP